LGNPIQHKGGVIVDTRSSIYTKQISGISFQISRTLTMIVDDRRQFSPRSRARVMDGPRARLTLPLAFVCIGAPDTKHGSPSACCPVSGLLIHDGSSTTFLYWVSQSTRSFLESCSARLAINCALMRTSIYPMPRQEISSHTEDTPLYLLVALCYIVLIITAFLAIVFDSPFLRCMSAR
jgi:hypothetical protein